MWILRTKVGSDDEERATFRVMPGSTKTMGRATRADFILDAALVSRVHCRFIAGDAGTLEVEDLKSTNGTFVNDRRVKRAPLEAGDRVRVGRMELVVERKAEA
ncbi:MAG TPA: FHA domain-containing protein [Vicinamibacterales bacterium]|jgi:pSer/pThr/pTyr-binding forkhead associated (FHA) protein